MSPRGPSRRSACIRLAGALLGLAEAAVLPGCQLLPAPGAVGVAQQVAPGVYLVRGAHGEIGPDNRGEIGNAAFIVGPNGVLAVDTGVSWQQGRRLLATIERHTGQRPRLAVLTQPRQEFLFGATAFQAAGVPLLMHRRAEQVMRSRCDRCLRQLQQQLGADTMQGSALPRPDRLIDGSTPLDEALIGRPIQLLHLGHGSGPGDIGVFDADSRTLLAGGWIDHLRIPDVQDGDLPGWRTTLDRLHELAPRLVVPGHGPAGPGPRLIDTTRRYLDQLEAAVARELAADTSLADIAQAVELPEFAGWDQYETTHRRNAAIVYLRLERVLLLQPSPRPAPAP
ncbi:glyoxylase-like metal-dependent hydrolase (beta-lactamase superfamily II) [Sphaerotilus hippei]|uniref:Glyoxylase-like metal-dependent hydrolase (Beta-lactamase superfamily II) n=1 Tax=Sphaerotilus hippei TaxID=744406 RepID=A0A318H2B8_9BURK|nr:MBL fold metallo-hydrolase [Sphaerotilus hippei]PXW95590.1 glyoxylase-like metal-dependent hydrolase (beta-lactamase superfamily II) [Sphaerotilus hippei]